MPWSCHFLVMASHFSGVVTMMLAFATSRQAPATASVSPVNSCTTQPKVCSNFFFQSATRSEHNDLVGACGGERQTQEMARPETKLRTM